MNSMRNFICVLTALVLAAFALPGMAGPQKTYSLVILAAPTYTNPAPPAEPVLNTPVSTTVTIKNESPPSTANSNIGSFTFSLDTVTIADPSAIVLQACPYLSPCFTDTSSNLSVSGHTISVTNISPPIQAQGTYNVTFGATSCGDGNVVNIGVFSGSQLNGAPFGFKPGASTLASSVNCGNLACGTSFTVPGSTPTVIGQRGLFDKDGGACSAGADTFEYYVTNTVGIVGGNLHFRWPVASEPNADPAAAFRYTISAASGNQPQVAWLTVSGNPVFIPAQQCLGDLPAPYTTLAAAVAQNDKKITVTDASGLPAVQFDIVIDTERMTVTKVQTSNGTLNVTRHVAGTSAATHAAGSPVMSTPLPILPAGTPSPYTVGNQAQMCLFATDVNSTTFIDIGDGWGNP